MNWGPAGLFIVGVVLTALGLTYVPSTNLLLAGIVIAAAGVLFSKLFKE